MVLLKPLVTAEFTQYDNMQAPVSETQGLGQAWEAQSPSALRPAFPRHGPQGSAEHGGRPSRRESLPALTPWFSEMEASGLFVS